MRPPSRSASEYRTVGILGGGTAGYLTALCLRAGRPELDVTVIESSKIPIIGVGEATTSEIVAYLHRILGLDVHQFYREVKPTWKLGIRFVWGLPGDHTFNFPFDIPLPLESLLYEGHLLNTSLLSILMEQKKGLVMARGAGEGFSLISQSPYAYHLDNKRFVQYLQKRAAEAGIRHLDREIVDARLCEDGESITALVTSGAEEFSYDLYVDCSGFRSFLLEQKLRSRFISFHDSLFTDRAIPADVPHHGILKPYTTAETMNCGWCWNIPQVESDHCGYVYSSAFCSDDEARAEMQRVYPEMRDPRLVKFRSGRHEHCWKGNVVAIGNAYGFVEPLESTGIQMILYETVGLVKYLPAHKSDTDSRQLLNQSIASKWDHLRWFLSIHYRFNKKLDTPFWQHCREATNISGAEEPLRLFRQAAPLFYRRFKEKSVGVPRPAFDDFGYDMLLLGQAVPAKFVDPIESREAYFGRTRVLQWLARCALPHERSLDVLLNGSEDLLSGHIQEETGWVAAFEKDFLQRA